MFFSLAKEPRVKPTSFAAKTESLDLELVLIKEEADTKV